MLRNWGKEAKKEGICIYIMCVYIYMCIHVYLWLIHIVVLQKPAQHYKALILQFYEVIILQNK